MKSQNIEIRDARQRLKQLAGLTCCLIAPWGLHNCITLEYHLTDRFKRLQYGLRQCHSVSALLEAGALRTESRLRPSAGIRVTKECHVMNEAIHNLPALIDNKAGAYRILPGGSVFCAGV